MKITILTYGSRGDVQPFIPLSLGLMARGHSVKLAAPARFRSLVEEEGIEFISLAGDPVELSRDLNDAGTNFVKTVRSLMQHAVEIGADIMQQVEDASKDTELIVHTFMHVIGAHTLAREMQIPDIHVQLFPMFTPTGDYPNITLPDTKLRFLNRWSHEISNRITFWTSKAGYEQVRHQAEFPKRKLYSPFDKDSLRPPTPILCAWSPSVLPPSYDWSSNVHVTGYLFGNPDMDYVPPPELQKFLDEKEAPICISFGSMVNRQSDSIDRIIREAVRKTDRRAIVLSGWTAIRSASSDRLLYLDAVPHQWLLPRCNMLIHHGGAGTTSAGLRAGIPSIVIPFAADQPFWGRRVHSIGAGPRPIPVKKLSVQNLCDAILEAETAAMRRSAQRIAQELSKENGVINCIEQIEKYSNEFPTSPR